MGIERLRFAPIDMHLHRDQALSFREDSFYCSFGDTSGFHRDEYIAVLEARLARDPWSAVHAWLGERIVGQMEFGQFKPDPSIGYINLYYLIPEQRGQGIAGQLDAHATDHLTRRGHRRAHLSVSPSNTRALRYYARHGWTQVGPRPEAPNVVLMHKTL
jgi:ribosomal protein S18 acetylase RimI-like enzyme